MLKGHLLKKIIYPLKNDMIDISNDLFQKTILLNQSQYLYYINDLLFYSKKYSSVSKIN